MESNEIKENKVTIEEEEDKGNEEGRTGGGEYERVPYKKRKIKATMKRDEIREKNREREVKEDKDNEKDKIKRGERKK